ncbi:MAG TPA: BamA/TamA family outer membrane protein [Usitatibacter sp.]|nr:BamA/TamA family outer membrane protein [Usitatibacter sp.]
MFRPIAVLLACLAVSLPVHALTVTWEAPQPLRRIFEENLKPPVVEQGERRRASLRPWERDVRRRVPEIAASEGYFSPTVEIGYDDEGRDHATVVVTLGTRTTVGSIDIQFAGDLAGEGADREARRRELREAWALGAGRAFRSPDWEAAKTRIEEALTDVDYAAGRLAASRAEVDAEAASAHLKLTLDSGPRFTLGDIRIEGLSRYPDAVIKRLVHIEPGERYSRARLIELQHLIQNGWWFSSVVVDTDRDPMKPNQVPVMITVTERPSREVGLALGYGTDDGARAEAAYRDRDLFSRGLDLQSSVRVSQKRQIGYADVYLPPGLWFTQKRGDIPFTDSVGILAEHNVIQNLAISRFAAAGYRHFKLETWELRAGLSYQVERTFPEGAEVLIKRALAPIIQSTWRHVDNVFDPRKGGVLALQFSAGSKSVASGDDFFRIYGQYQYWIPVGNDQILLRTELGRNFTASPERIPEDFLFRAGGSRSNRGYAYQSLGVQQGNAVVGGRYLATATVEYVHWLNERWGAAVFTDVGDASDSIRTWDPLKSYGVGARFRTPAGPFALDLAYADRDRKFRLAFSVTVAF